MSVAMNYDVNISQLSIESRYALDILQNLSIEQINQLKHVLPFDALDVIEPQTLTALVSLCQDKGITLTEAGVNAFKATHHLGNTGAHQGIIGPQTAGVYFRILVSNQTNHAAQSPMADLNTAIVAATQQLFGMCTVEGPDNGQNACAWSVNQVLRTANLPALGDNPNYVPSLLEALINGRGMEVKRADAKAGDLVIAYGEAHIGIGLDDGCRTVLSNSSSRGQFCWKSDTDFDGYYGGSSSLYRLVR